MARSRSSCAMVRRDRFTSEVGPEASGSKPGMEPCTHMPEKSGMDVAISLLLPVDPPVGTTTCPKTGAAATAVNIMTKRKSRRCQLMLAPTCRPTSATFQQHRPVADVDLGVRAWLRSVVLVAALIDIDLD